MQSEPATLVSSMLCEEANYHHRDSEDTKVAQSKDGRRLNLERGALCPISRTLFLKFPWTTNALVYGGVAFVSD